MTHIVIAGGGVLGSQIAFQTAYCGFDTTIWLRSEGSIGRTKPKLEQLRATYLQTIDDMAQQKPGCWAMGIADPEHFDAAACRTQASSASPPAKAFTATRRNKDAKLALS